MNRRQEYETRLRRKSLLVAGVSTALVVLAIVLLVPLAPGWEGVKSSFFNAEIFAKTFPKLLKAFMWDIAIFAWSVPLICVLGQAKTGDAETDQIDDQHHGHATENINVCRAEDA